MTPPAAAALTPFEAVKLAVDVERRTGLRIGRVREVTIMAPVNGTCLDCGAPCQFINVMLCDDCLPPPATCDTCGEPAVCFMRGEGDRCQEHARAEWGW